MVGKMLLLMETSRCLRSARHRARRAQARCASPQPNAFSTQCLYSPAVPIRGPSAAVAPPLQDLNSAEAWEGAGAAAGHLLLSGRARSTPGPGFELFPSVRATDPAPSRSVTFWRGSVSAPAACEQAQRLCGRALPRPAGGSHRGARFW